MAEFDVGAVVRAMEHATKATRAEVATLLRQAGDEFAADHMQSMPRGMQYRRQRRTGRALADSLRRVVHNPLLTVFYNTAPHLHLVEFGTRDRYDSTRKNAFRGRMPNRGQTFVPLAIRNRARFFAAAEALLTRSTEL